MKRPELSTLNRSTWSHARLWFRLRMSLCRMLTGEHRSSRAAWKLEYESRCNRPNGPRAVAQVRWHPFGPQGRRQAAIGSCMAQWHDVACMWAVSFLCLDALARSAVRRSTLEHRPGSASGDSTSALQRSSCAAKSGSLSGAAARR